MSTISTSTSASIEDPVCVLYVCVNIYIYTHTYTHVYHISVQSSYYAQSILQKVHWTYNLWDLPSYSHFHMQLESPFWGFQALLVPSLSYQRVLMLVGMEHVGLRSMAAFSYAPDSFVTFLSSFGKALMHPEKGSWCTTLWWSSCMVPVCSRAACTFGVRQQVFVNSPTCSWPTLSLWSVALTCTSWSRAFSTSWTPHSWV